MEVVKVDGTALEFASEELRHDREVVMKAVKQNGMAIRFASEDLRHDRGINDASRQSDW